MISSLQLLIYMWLLVGDHFSEATTHWIVTEDGKLQSQEDSIFSLRRPHDLASFLHQEQRMQQLLQIKQQLMEQKKIIEETSVKSESSQSDGTVIIDTESDMEQVVYSSHEDCIKAGKPLPEFDLFGGTVMILAPKPDADAKKSSVDDFYSEVLR